MYFLSNQVGLEGSIRGTQVSLEIPHLRKSYWLSKRQFGEEVVRIKEVGKELSL
jgi:hypothetical protein